MAARTLLVGFDVPGQCADRYRGDRRRVLFVPTSRDPTAPPFDVPGLVLSAIGVTALVYTVIEAPDSDGPAANHRGVCCGRRGPRRLRAVGAAAPSDARRDGLRQRRFSAASAAVTVAFLTLFGFIFLITQYFQFVRGYGPPWKPVCARCPWPSRSPSLRCWRPDSCTWWAPSGGGRQRAGALMSVAFVGDRPAGRGRHRLHRDRRARVLLGVGLGLDLFAGHRVDHGLALGR